MKNVLNKLSITILICLIVFINVCTALISMKYIYYLQYSKCLFILGIIAFIIYVLSKIVNKEKFALKDLFVVILLGLGVLSYIFAYRKDVALNGMLSRYEGLKSLFSYYMIFLLATQVDTKWQKRLMNILIVFGLLQVIIGTLQVLQIKNILGYSRADNFSTSYRFACGTLGNPNFYSTFMILILMYVYSLLINQKKNRWLYLILFLIFGYGLLIGNTLGCVLAAIIMGVIILIRKINKQTAKKISLSVGALLVLLIPLGFIINKVSNQSLNKIIIKDVNEVKNVMQDGLKESTGNYRIYIWKESLKKFPQYYKTGIGIDNFGFLNDGTYFCSPEECFDKAHNEYIQILLTEGLLTLIVYLSFITMILLRYRKAKRKNAHNAGLVYATITYLIQAIFNISVIQVAPILYMYLGFIYNTSKDKKI